MSLNGDGTANCDRCGVDLPGFGVIYGLVCSHLTAGTLEELIFCYVNRCRDVVLAGLVNALSNDQTVRCSEDGAVLAARSVDVAMLLTDLDPDSDGARYLQLCYEYGSRDRLLSNAGRTP